MVERQCLLDSSLGVNPVHLRIGHVATALCVLACAGCGIGALSASEADGPSRVPVETTTSAPTEVTTPPPYVAPDPDVAQVARRFVRQALSYDSCAADREGFPQQVADLATKGELRRLRASARAHLRWWVLCQRKERAEVHIDGVGQEPASGDIQVVRVEALRATRSDIS